MFSSSDSSSEDENPGFLRNPDGSLAKVTNGPNFDKALTRQDKLSKLANETNRFLRKYGGPFSSENWEMKRKKILTERSELKEASRELRPLDDFAELQAIDYRIEYLEKTLGQLNIKKKQMTLQNDGSLGDALAKPVESKPKRKHRMPKHGPMDTYFQNNVYTPPPARKIYRNAQTSPFPSRQASRQVSEQSIPNDVPPTPRLNSVEQVSSDIFDEILSDYRKGGPSIQSAESTPCVSEVPRKTFSKDPKDDDELPDFDLLTNSFADQLTFEMNRDIYEGDTIEKNWALMNGYLYDLKDFAEFQMFLQDKEEMREGGHYPDIEYLDDDEARQYRKNH